MQESSGKLRIGKLPPDLIARVIREVRPFSDALIIQGPGIGVDAAIMRLPCCDLAFHTDPITEAGSRMGWLALNVAANDVAASGACPKWASIAVLLPPGSDVGVLEETIAGIARAARELRIDVAGGHTEVSPGLSKPVVVATVIGITCRRCTVTAGGARPGDSVIMIGYAGAEGTSILASDFRATLEKCGIDSDTINAAISLGERISIVKPACRLAVERIARAMHDVTEGGMIGSLVEMAIASSTRIRVDPSRVPVHPATRRIAECLGIDPLKLIGSGGLVAVVPRVLEERALETARSLGYPAAVIGRVEEGGPALVLEGDRPTIYYEPPRDEIARVWELAEGPQKGERL